MRRNIRVMFANCPHLDDGACAFLILAQNAVQRVFEFEVYRLSIEAEFKKLDDMTVRALKKFAGMPNWMPYRRSAERRSRARLERLLWQPLRNQHLDLKTWRGDLEPLVRQHDAWLDSLPVSYGNWTMRKGPLIILTETPLSGEYLSVVGDDFAVVNLGDWPKYAPPSVFEYAVTSVQRAALRMSINRRIGCHYATRGCVWDFTAHQPDVRLALVGAPCDACWQLIAEAVTANERKELEYLLSQKWIGDTDQTGSAASTIKRVFGFDLALTRGLSPSFREKLRENVPSAVVTLAVAAVGGIASVLFTAWLRHMGWVR